MTSGALLYTEATEVSTMGSGDDDILSFFLSACNTSFCSPLSCVTQLKVSLHQVIIWLPLSTNMNRMVRRLKVNTEENAGRGNVTAWGRWEVNYGFLFPMTSESWPIWSADRLCSKQYNPCIYIRVTLDYTYY